MKDLLSKKAYCYKIYILQINSGAYPPPPPPLPPVWITSSYLSKEILDSPFSLIFQKSHFSQISPLNKRERGHPKDLL